MTFTNQIYKEFDNEFNLATCLDLSSLLIRFILFRSHYGVSALLTACFIHICHMEIRFLNTMAPAQIPLHHPHGVPQGSLLGPFFSDLYQ